jgi:hypothetical protein
LLEKYSEALNQSGTRPSPFPEKDGTSEGMNWMLTKFKALLNVISSSSDSVAVFSVDSLLKLQENHDCFDLDKFRGGIQRFRDAASTSTIRANEDVRTIMVKFVNEF